MRIITEENVDKLTNSTNINHIFKLTNSKLYKEKNKYSKNMKIYYNEIRKLENKLKLNKDLFPSDEQDNDFKTLPEQPKNELPDYIKEIINLDEGEEKEESEESEEMVIFSKIKTSPDSFKIKDIDKYYPEKEAKIIKSKIIKHLSCYKKNIYKDIWLNKEAIYSITNCKISDLITNAIKEESKNPEYGLDDSDKIVIADCTSCIGGNSMSFIRNFSKLICIEIDPNRIQRRIDTKYLDCSTKSLEEALSIAKESMKKNNPISIGLLGNAADVIPEVAEIDFVPDIVTDQTSAHDELVGYIPNNYSIEEANYLRQSDKEKYIFESKRSMGEHVRGMLKLKDKGSIVFDYGNNIRSQALYILGFTAAETIQFG